MLYCVRVSSCRCESCIDIMIHYCMITAQYEYYCDRFYSYDGQYTNEALNNNKYFIRPWSLSESDYMKISPQSGEISKNIISKCVYFRLTR